MKLFRNLFSLLKRHYEKVILTLALVGLIGAVWYLNEMKTEENGKIEKYEKETARRKSSPIPLVDMKELSTAMAHATNAPGLNFSPPHNLFNPVKWQQRPDRTRIKAETGRELGINAVQIVTNTPLHLIITLDAQAGSGAQMSTTMETNRLAQRIRSYVTTNSTSDRLHRSHAFTLRDFRITADGPEADLELTDGTKTTVTASKGFTRIEGYKSDMIYPPEPNLFLKDKRVGDFLTVAGEEYIIVAISSNEVVVSARSNDRRTTIRGNVPP